MDDRAIIVFQCAFEQGIALDLDQCETIATLLKGEAITPMSVREASAAFESVRTAVRASGGP